MARKTFISYKYSDSKDTRDRIIKALGNDATYYKGETSDSPNMDDFKTETIRKKLSDMIYDTSVLIVVISTNVDKSEWVKWEINYATSKQTRGNRQSQPDGVVMVIEDYLIDFENKYKSNQTTKLVCEKSNPIICSLNSFLKNPKCYIEQAFEKSQGANNYGK